MNNLNGNRKNEFRRKQEEKQRKLALKIKDEAGELREGSLKSEEAIPSLDELCAMGERVEQQTTFSAKEAIRNKIKARRDAERYKTTSTDSEKWTPNPFEDSNAAAIESPKNEDILNTTRKHADAQSTKSAGLKTSKRRSIVEMVQKLKKYVPIVVCGDVLYYYNGYYYEAIGLEKLIKLYRKYVDYDLNNEPSLYAYKDLYQCCTTDPELERSEPENQSIHAPLENGVYDLMKKELKPHDPRRLIFTYMPHRRSRGLSRSGMCLSPTTRGTGSTVTARPGRSPSGSPQGPRSRPPMTHSVNCEVKCRCIYPV